MSDAFFALGLLWKMIYRTFCGFSYVSFKTLLSKFGDMEVRRYDISFIMLDLKRLSQR